MLSIIVNGAGYTLVWLATYWGRVAISFVAPFSSFIQQSL
jgi:hypothetical protein